MKIPGYIKFVFLSLAVIIFFFFLYVASFILIPMALGLLLAILLLPINRFFEKIRLSRFWAVLLTIIIAFIVLSAVIVGLSIPVSRLIDDIPQIGEKLLGVVGQFQEFFKDNLDMEPQFQSDYIKDHLSNILQRGSAFFSGTLTATANAFSFGVILLLSVFFILYYRSFFREFLERIFPDHLQETLSRLIANTKRLVSDYINGLLLMMLTVGTLNTLGLWILGIEYPILWGGLSGLLAVIPYIGISIGGLLPFLFALVTTDSLLYPLGVVAIFGFVQFLEGNFITPNIMSNKVSLNPYAVIIAIFIGGKIWGIAGIILFIPYLAVLKNILDEFEQTKAVGFLLGNPDREQENPGTWEKLKEKLGLNKD
ncbi:AI-2E family transporter [Nonlabens marinus]|uniref:Putative permease often clustered with de novo purine synthesis n=1 Tax=Nonlabens marinus S1-08 TaxID=1454201 RepID=W8VZN9_9FLAO|nr:AI-2E family transporter [Nonlabens marinus]BAO54906.1 putative permease often clustered with de novo purine synthesis [Nonlabens marinus S1-08]